jgi:flagellar basal-body rod protein FlgC
MISDLKNNTAFHSLNISASGMMAQRRRLDAIAQNLANLETTRTAEGGPYKPKETIFAENPEKHDFFKLLAQQQLPLEATHWNHLVPDPYGVENLALSGVEVEVRDSERPPRLEYDPDHPDADADGYVAYPDINLVEEISHLVLATRAYEANVTAIRAAKELAARGLEI